MGNNHIQGIPSFEEFKGFMEVVQHEAKTCALDFANSNSKNVEKMDDKSLEEVLEITGSVLLDDFISEFPC